MGGTVTDVPEMSRELVEHIMFYTQADGMRSVVPSQEESDYWKVGELTPLTYDTVSVELTVSQWAGVMAMIRLAAGISDKPGITKLAHDAIQEQIRAAKPEIFGHRKKED